MKTSVLTILRKQSQLTNGIWKMNQNALNQPLFSNKIKKDYLLIKGNLIMSIASQNPRCTHTKTLSPTGTRTAYSRKHASSVRMPVATIVLTRWPRVSWGTTWHITVGMWPIGARTVPKKVRGTSWTPGATPWKTAFSFKKDKINWLAVQCTI